MQRVVHQWHIPPERVCAFLQVTPITLAALALAPVLPPESDGGDAQIQALASRYGIAAWRLAFLGRQAFRSPVRLRD